jgi:hypothetical protein
MIRRLGHVLRDEYVDGTREVEVDLDRDPEP